MSNQFKACYLSDIATAMGVDVRTLQSYIGPNEQIRMLELGHNFYIDKRKLKPKVVEFLIREYVPEICQDSLRE